MRVYQIVRDTLVFDYSNVTVYIKPTEYPNVAEIHVSAHVERFDVTTFYSWLQGFESLKKTLNEEYGYKLLISYVPSTNKKVIKFWKMFGLDIRNIDTEQGDVAYCYIYLED